MKRIAPCAFFVLLLTVLTCATQASSPRAEFQIESGAIVRGPTNSRQIALVFTAHTYAEGADAMCHSLESHHAHASFFLTGDFLINPQFAPIVRRIIHDGDYIGPHSDKHLLYCDWGKDRKTLVSQEQFNHDVDANLHKIEHFGIPRAQITCFLPAYEQPNEQIADWSQQLGLTLINYTPGTRSNADYTSEKDRNFVSSQAIYDSILKKEQSDSHGLNGFILLLHLGVGPTRSDKFTGHFDALLDYLQKRGYQFVRVDDLLGIRK
ncbi:MAG TPA: polysaccharide deacetylase family protein [Tepidisphaeraceae bacterium]|jgi:peptidoglycan/xylan/chitin deacetylase (PgdA/CDA1 family)